MEHNKDFMENIEGLLKRRENSTEQEEVTPVPFFQEFIESEMAKCEEASSEFPKKKPDVEKLNELFQAVLG